MSFYGCIACESPAASPRELRIWFGYQRESVALCEDCSCRVAGFWPGLRTVLRRYRGRRA
jgi:hypothetical protein